MHITLVPIRSDDPPLVLSREGEALVIDGARFDFSPLAEGDVLPREAVACPRLASDVTREGGRIRLALVFPHGPGAAGAARFPAPVIDPAEGPVALPASGAGGEGGEGGE